MLDNSGYECAMLASTPWSGAATIADCRREHERALALTRSAGLAEIAMAALGGGGDVL